MLRAKAFDIHIFVQLDFLALMVKSIPPRVVGEDNQCLMLAFALIWDVVVQWLAVNVRDAFFVQFIKMLYHYINLDFNI